MDRLKHIVRALEGASTQEDIASAMREATAMLGFDHFTLGTTFVHLLGAPRRFIVTNAPEKWLQWYDEHQIMTYDPVIQRALLTLTPFYTDQIPLSDLGAKALEFVVNAVKYGTAFALVAQQHAPGGGCTVALFGRGLMPVIVDRDDKAAMAGLVVAYAHEAMMRVVVGEVIRKKSGPGALTDNERECLALLSRGRTGRQAAADLGVSASTVSYYLERAMKKMGAARPKEAIAKALATNEIAAVSPRAWSASDVLLERRSRPGAVGTRATLNDVVDDVEASHSFEELCDALEAATALLKMTWFAFVMRAQGVRHELRQFVLARYPDALRRLADDSHEVHHHRALGGGPFTALPVFWDHPGVPAISGITSMALGPGGSNSALMLAGGDGSSAPDRFELAWATARLARALHQRVLALGLQVPQLSACETECLRMISEGAGLKNVGKLLGCSERMARYRLNRVARRMGLRNYQEAVVQAVAWGLLPPRHDRPTTRESDRFFRVA